MPADSRAVVIVSGGGATTPFTTPTRACSTSDGYLSAGNTATALRDYLLAHGKQVYTVPTRSDWGVVDDSASEEFGPFKDCPIVLPEHLTIMSAGDIGWGGERLTRFLLHLHSDYGVTEVDLVGHSNGGLWSRAAIWVLKHTDAPITVRSLITLGTPHEGSVPGRFTFNEIGLDAFKGDAFAIKFNQDWVPYANAGDKGINREDTERFLMGPDGWNTAQGSVLAGIPITLLAGTYFQLADADPTVWPNDATVSRSSALAERIPDSILPSPTRWEAPLVHSIFTCKYADLDWQKALTWNADALARVNQAIDEA